MIFIESFKMINLRAQKVDTNKQGNMIPEIIFNLISELERFVVHPFVFYLAESLISLPPPHLTSLRTISSPLK